MASGSVNGEVTKRGTKMKEITTYNVAPGVWRVRLGQPEKFTPLGFRTNQLRKENFDGLPACSTFPLQLRDISFRYTVHGCAVELPMETDEHVYGFGLNTRIFDKTNRRVFIRPSDQPENELNESHAPVPFYVSTSGYGVYVDTARYASFYTGNVSPLRRKGASGGDGKAATDTDELYKARELNVKTMLIDIPAVQGVDIYIFGGPAMVDAVSRYNQFSGGGVVPPLWGLGMVYRGYSNFNAADSLELAKSFREQHIPCDIWGLEPGWQTKAYSSSFVWDSGRFPDPDGYIKSMRDMGYHMSVWQHAFTHPSSPIYEALKPWAGNYLVWDGLVPDFATKVGRRIFVGQQDKELYQKGVDAVKLDECDNQPSSPSPWSFPDVTEFPSGLDGEQMHSLFGLLYQQAMLEPLQKHNKRTWGLARNSYALAASLPYVIYSDSYDDRCYVRGMANQGFSGLLWVPEVRDTQTIEELYRRVEVVIFSPQALINPWYMMLPPWLQIEKDASNRRELMPNHEEVTAVIRKLFELRMSLVPYYYTAFNEYRLHGTPPIRALVMDWPDDPATYQVDDQFMVGDSLIVAPIFAGQTQRLVYLPKEDWYDFWTGEKLAGARTISVTKPMDQIPMYIKNNTLLPLAKPVEHISSSTCFELTVKAYGSNPAPFTLFEDDGETYDYEKGLQNRIILKYTAADGSQTRTGSYKGPERYKIIKWDSVN